MGASVTEPESASESESTFQGGARARIVAELQDRFLGVAMTGRPALEVLTGHAGSGKTRVAREFYRCLAQSTAGDYWPPQIQGDRKRVRVDHAAADPSPGPPQWFYWGIEASDPSWSMTEDVARVRELVRSKPFRGQTSWGYVGVVWSTFQWRTRLREIADTLKEDIVYEVAMRVLATLKHIFPRLEHAGMLYATLKKHLFDRIVRAVLRSRTGIWLRAKFAGKAAGSLGGVDRRRVRSEARVHARRMGEIQALIEHLSRAMPVLIVVDDLHEAADENADDLLSLLGSLLRMDRPILALVTAVSDALDKRPAIAALWRTRVHYYRDVIDVDEAQNRLTMAERRALIAEACPQLAPNAQSAVATSFETNLFLMLEKVRDEKFRRTAQYQTALRLSGLTDLEQNYLLERWNALPAEMRGALELAVLASPSGITDFFARESTWDGVLPAAAVTAAADPALQGWRTELQALHAQAPSGSLASWLRKTEANAWEWRCTEYSQYEWVLQRARDAWRGSISAYRDALAACIRGEFEETKGDERRHVARCRLLVAIARDRDQLWWEEAVAAVDFLRLRAERDGRFETAIALASDVRDPDVDRGAARDFETHRLTQRVAAQPAGGALVWRTPREPDVLVEERSRGNDPSDVVRGGSLSEHGGTAPPSVEEAP